MPALDQNLFTLKLKRSEEEPGALDLVDPQGTIYYRKRLIPPSKLGEPGPSGLPWYDLWDPMSDSLLATLCVVPGKADKKRTIQLYNPTAEVELTFTGTFNFRWQFQWEEHTFEFKKEECFLLRRPDPPVLVAVYEFERKQNKPEAGLVQLMDYNLTRFDINDRKGLEIVLMTGFLSFQDQILGISTDSGGLPSPTGEPVSSPGGGILSRVTSTAPPPVLPPKDVGMQVAGLQLREKSAPNEVVVTAMFEVEEYADYACGLLKDPKMLYIVVRSKTTGEVPKVVAVASLVKRMRYKGGAHDEDLHQYAKYEEAKAAGPKVIKLDGPAEKDPSKSYQPPTALSIHLSKIAMPELQPRARPSTHSAAPSSSSSLQVQDNDRRGRGGFLRKKDPNHGRSGSSPGPQPPRPATQPVQPSGNSRPAKGSSAASLGPQGYASPPFPRPASASPSTGPPSARSSFWGLGSSRDVAPQLPPAPPPLAARPQPTPSPGSPPFPMPGAYFSGAAPPPPPPPPPSTSGPLSSLLSGMMPHPPGQNPSSTQIAVTNAAQALENGAMDIYGRFRGSRR